MAVYADFDFYENTYGGTAIASADFTKLITRASLVIDQITYNRAATVVEENTDTDTIQKIQLAACAIADEIQRQENESAAVIASERVGEHSVSYVVTEAMKQTALEQQSAKAKLYLASTGLMFKGFYADEYGSNTI